MPADPLAAARRALIAARSALLIFDQAAEVYDFYAEDVLPQEICLPSFDAVRRMSDDGPCRAVLDRSDFYRARTAVSAIDAALAALPEAEAQKGDKIGYCLEHHRPFLDCLGDGYRVCPDCWQERLAGKRPLVAAVKP